MKLPDYLFTSSVDGGLYDTRMPNWSHNTPLRAIYCRTFERIDNTLQLRATLRAGPVAWPGCYPLVFLCADGECLAFETVREEYRLCARAIRDHDNSGWRIVGCFVHWEGEPIVCAHSGRMIASAYGPIDSEVTE